ncbi:MAG: hypothetical protein HYX61_04615 [Gammaproteobacteria bacterium]|jgi:hypothetical protein|nr:hypothetical protein [Gammaproteobacteria bacterium]
MPKTSQDRHLNRLPQKSFKVAPGDVVGGMIYIMDKPLGVEEGMIGMSIDSQPYRDYIQSMIELFQHRQTLEIKADIGNPALEKRYNELVKLDSFTALSEAEQNILIDLLIHDPKIDEYIKNITDSDTKAAVQEFADKYINKAVRNVPHREIRHGYLEGVGKLFSGETLHEYRGGETDYINQGLGGLILDAYQDHCGVKKNEHFASKIQKIIYNGKKEPPEGRNDVYMVKQDGELRSGNRTGPGFRKRLKTTQGKSWIAPLLNPLIVGATLGISAGIAYGILRATSRKSSTVSSNSDAIVETIATNVAKTKGMQAQSIETIEGTYENGSPKLATVVKWSPGCRDLSGRLQGSKDFDDVITVQSNNGEEVRVDSQHNLLVKRKDKVTKEDIYEHVSKEGTTRTPISKKEFEAGQAVAEDRIAGLGESLIAMLSSGDRDGMGKKGQNKAITPLDPPVDNKIFQFYGIDYGKAYVADNPVIKSLSDDFSFQNLKGADAKLTNYSAMYDNPLREKMKGIYLLAALRGKLDDAAKEAIIQDYAQGNDSDKKFAEKLATYPGTPPDGVGKDGDLRLIKLEEAKFRQLAKNEEDKIKRDEFLAHADKLNGIFNIAKETDKIILDTFEKRMNLTPSKIDVLENMEKLTATKASVLSPDGKVQLNHIRVDRKDIKDRIAWQFDKDDNLVSSDKLSNEQRANIKSNIISFKNTLVQQEAALRSKNDKKEADELKSLISKISAVNLDLSPIKIALNKDELKLLHAHLNEENVATSRPELTGFRTKAVREDFHDRLQTLNKYPPGKERLDKDEEVKLNSLDATENVTNTPLEVLQARLDDVPDLVQSVVPPNPRVRANSMPQISVEAPNQAKPTTTKRVRDDDTAEPPKKRPTGIRFSSPPLAVPTPVTQPMAVQSQFTLDNLITYLNKAPHKFHHIEEVVPPVKTGSFEQHRVQTIYFKDPEDASKTAKVYAQKSQDSNLIYATDIDMEDAKFKYAVEQTCRLAVFSAEPNAEFTISEELPIEKQKVIRDAFDKAIKEASTITNSVPHPPFNDDTKPTVKAEGISSKLTLTGGGG